VKMMLREGDAIISMLIQIPGLLSQVAQHPLIQIRPPPGHPGADFGFAADAGQVQDSNFHFRLPLNQKRWRLWAIQTRPTRRQPVGRHTSARGQSRKAEKAPMMSDWKSRRLRQPDQLWL
jgi:hypothetical protein